MQQSLFYHIFLPHRLREGQKLLIIGLRLIRIHLFAKKLFDHRFMILFIIR